MHPVLNISLANDSIFFDETLSRLLYEIDIKHSVREACMSTGISYSSGWNKIRLLESQIGCPIVNRTQGGAVGAGRSELTEKGRLLLRLYKSFYEKLSRDMEKRFHETFDDVFTREIFLICSGSCDKSGRFFDGTSAPLSGTGRIQSCLLWRELSGKKIMTALCADSTASMQTSEIIFGQGTAKCSAELRGVSHEALIDFFADVIDNSFGNTAIIAERETICALLSTVPRFNAENSDIRDGSYCVISSDGGIRLKNVITLPHPEQGRVLCTKILHAFFADDTSVNRILHDAEIIGREAFYSGDCSEEAEIAEILMHVDEFSDDDIPVAELMDKLGYPEIAEAMLTKAGKRL